MLGHTFIPPVLRGRRPEKPPRAAALGFSNTLWGLVQLCWDVASSSRPTARELLEQLSIDSPAWIPPTEYPVLATNASRSTDSDSSDSSLGSLANPTLEVGR